MEVGVHSGAGTELSGLCSRGPVPGPGALQGLLWACCLHAGFCCCPKWEGSPGSDAPAAAAYH